MISTIGSRKAARKIALTAAALATASFVAVPAAFAQSPAKGPAAATPPAASANQSATNIPDAKLDAAAAAVKGISSVKTDYQQKAAQATDADKERIVSEANAAMAKAVTDQGLTVDEYTNIITVAQNDPAVHQKLVSRLK